MKKILLMMTAFILCGCMGIPKNVSPVKEFDIDKYMGKWYEIVRLDHSFERGLDQVTAEYSLKEDGGVRVINRGFSKEKNKWNEAQGKAYFVKESNQGYLKVSFFGPFYGSYIIFELDKENYQYAFVCGPNTSYLWLLSRTPTIDKALLTDFIDKAKELGFDTEKLIYVNHQKLGSDTNDPN